MKRTRGKREHMHKNPIIVCCFIMCVSQQTEAHGKFEIQQVRVPVDDAEELAVVKLAREAKQTAEEVVAEHNATGHVTFGFCSVSQTGSSPHSFGEDETRDP